MSLNAKLLVVGGDVKTEEIKLRLPSTIGRGKGTTIMLAHPLVSRQHCELYEADGQLMVRDLGSLNGTFVNNQKISEAPLPPGELLTIGTVTFRAVYESQGEVSPPKGPAPQLKAGKASASADTLKAGPKAAKPAAKPPATDDLEFDFEKPLMPLDDVETPSGGPLHSTKRLEASPANAPAAKAAEKKPEAKNPPAKQTKPSSPATKASPAKPAAPASPAGKSPAGKPPGGRGDAATIDFKKQLDDDEDDEKVASSSDDDLDDFLKSLEK
jgi:predicted component of type VI protein secretion system